MMYSVILDIPDSYFEKIIQDRKELGEEIVVGQNNFEEDAVRIKYLRDFIENELGFAIVSIKEHLQEE
ncbi:MAG: hypothetical protein ACFFD1_00295 [Candidatus Thorarchaeota archaeon]